MREKFGAYEECGRNLHLHVIVIYPVHTHTLTCTINNKSIFVVYQNQLLCDIDKTNIDTHFITSGVMKGKADPLQVQIII